MHRSGQAADAEFFRAVAVGIPAGVARQAQFFGDLGVLIQQKQAEISLERQQQAFQMSLAEQANKITQQISQTIESKPLPVVKPLPMTRSFCPIFGDDGI